MAQDRVGPREEIRLACVFNGGVSLAVWMGGVAHEVNEFTRPQSSYGPLLDLLRTRSRADVISGTSAGGINGAALALAQANEGTDLADLRVVWGEQGRLETLLNTPFRGDPSSLLRGEEVFLPELTRALHRLAAPWQPREVRDRPIDLTVTTTLLDGVTLRQTDSFGQPLDQKRHDVQFRFARQVDGAGRVVDDFSDPDAPADRPAPDARVLDALGLAARASAGFPVAFEPTLIPVDAGAEPGDRPDMARYASWRGVPDPADGSFPDRSRYAVDGGLLNNTPTQHALGAIEQMRADVAVDRVMLLVIPLPSEQVTEAGATAEEPPTLLEVALGLAGSVTSTGSRNYVEDIVRHNRRATALRGTRGDVLATARSSGGDAAASLTATATDLYPHYRRLRLRREARDLASAVPLPPGRPYDTVRARLEAVQAALDAAPPGATSPTAVLPATLAGFAARADGAWEWGTKPLLDVGAGALEYLARLVESWPVADHGPVHEARRGVHDALAQVRWVRRALDSAWEESPALVRLAPDLDYWRLRLAVEAWLLRGTPSAWQMLTTAAQRLGIDVAAALGPVVEALHGQDPQGPVPPPDAAGGLAGRLLGRALTRLVAAVVAPTQDSSPVAAEVRHQHSASLLAVFDEPWLPLLAAASDPDPQAARREVTRLLLALHVASWTIGDELPTENTNPVRFLQVSAATDNHFATYSTTVQDKLGGASLARFSGFLKRSWRMNDWTWGRLDGATALLRVLLTPQRVRRVAIAHRLAQPRDVVALLLETAWGAEAAAVLLRDPEGARPGGLPRLAGVLRGAVAEVADALAPTWSTEPARDVDAAALPHLAALLTYGRHLRIIHRELPEVAAAIEVDAHEGANRRSRGALFVAQTGQLRERLALTGGQPGSEAWLRNGLEALAAFDGAGIGREPLDEEAAGDQLIRTAVTAAGVVATVAAGKRSGLGVIAPVTRALKGVTMVPYWVTRGLTAGGGTARALGLLGLAAGGVMLALALLGVLDGTLAGAVTVLGAGAFVAALTYGALRTGSYLHGTVLTAVAVVLLAVGLSRGDAAWDPGAGIGAAVGTAVLVLGLILLGSLREPMSSPKVAVEDAAVRFARALAPTEWVEDRLTGIRRLGVAGAVVGAAAVVVLLVAAGAARPDRLPAWFAPGQVPRWLPWAGGLAVVVLAAVTTAVALLAWPAVARLATRQGVPPATGPRGLLARSGLLVIVAAVLGLSAALVAQAAGGLPEALLLRFARWVGTPAAPLQIGLGAALLAALATLGVLLGSRGLRRWQRVGGQWRRERGSGPEGVAAGWSVVYGAGALLLAALALLWWPDPPSPAEPPEAAPAVVCCADPEAADDAASAFWSVEWVVGALVLFAVLLLAVAPAWMLARAHRRTRALVEQTLERQAAAARTADRSSRAVDLSPTGQADWLAAHGRAYSAAVGLTADTPQRLTMRPWAVRPPDARGASHVAGG